MIYHRTAEELSGGICYYVGSNNRGRIKRQVKLTDASKFAIETNSPGRIIIWPDQMLMGNVYDIVGYIRGNGSQNVIVGTMYYLTYGALGQRGMFPVTVELISDNSFDPINPESNSLLNRFISIGGKLSEWDQADYDKMVQQINQEEKKHINTTGFAFLSKQQKSESVTKIGSSKKLNDMSTKKLTEMTNEINRLKSHNDQLLSCLFGSNSMDIFIQNMEVSTAAAVVVQTIDNDLEKQMVHVLTHDKVETLFGDFYLPYITVPNFNNLYVYKFYNAANCDNTTFVKFNDASKIIEFVFNKHHTTYKFSPSTYDNICKIILSKCENN